MTIGMENGAFGQVETLGAWSLKALGAMAVVRPGNGGSLQVVVGPMAEGAAEKRYGKLPDKVRHKVLAMCAAAAVRASLGRAGACSDWPGDACS